MRQLFFVVFLFMLILINATAQQTTAQTAAEVSFTFTRQSGHATNQFAIWIEDSQGRHIKTLNVTRFTARGGWSRRPDSIPIWVKQSGVAEMTRVQIDAVSNATPRTGTLIFTWDGTNSRGTSVPDGEYLLVLEGTLRWENRVIYHSPIVLGQGATTAEITVEYFGESVAEHSMLSNVRVRALR